MQRLARDVWRAGRGRPRAAILGGVHGNELTGVEVVRRLVERFSNSGDATALRGELTLAIGNPDAVERGVRFVHDDLNRCFADGASANAGVDDGFSIERSRAAELCGFLEDLDVLVDLHATNKPSAPFARLPGSIDSAHFGRCERLFLSDLPDDCTTVLWDPRGLIGGGRMSDEFALRHSAHLGCFICLESGLASDVGVLPAVSAAVNTLLLRMGMVQGGAPPVSSGRAWTHYAISSVFRLEEQGFKWANGHGQMNFEHVPAGRVYGQRGMDGSPLVAVEDSYIVFPKVQSLWKQGQPLGWLATRISVPSLPAV